MGAAKKPIAIFLAIHWPLPLAYGLQTLMACMQSAYFDTHTDQVVNLQSWQRLK
jgi:hypothetical protein